jgi:hypothetical protein
METTYPSTTRTEDVAVIVQSKYGPVSFSFQSANAGTARFEPFTLRGVKYGGYIAFKNEQRPHGTRPVSEDYNNSYMRRTVVDHSKGIYADRMTDAARSEVTDFVLDTVEKLFADKDLMQAAHVAQIERMVKREQGEVNGLAATLDKKTAQLVERMKQAKLGAPFCDATQKYNDGTCMLPKGHKDEHEYGKR